MLGRHFAVLDEAERQELVDAVKALPDMTWLRSERERVRRGVRPPSRTRRRASSALYDGLWHGGVDGPTLDACRDRIDALLQFAPDPTTDRPLDAAGRAAVAYAEQYALDPHGLRDADFVALHEHFDDAQLATLTLAVAMFDARARFACALEV